MTMSLTFEHTVANLGANLRGTMILLAALLIAGPAPVSACENAVPTLVPSAPPEARSTAVFTGEFVNGVPVYRLPSINVVAHRSAEVAKAKREDSTGRSVRQRPSSAAAPVATSRSLASGSQETNPRKPCIG